MSQQEGSVNMYFGQNLYNLVMANIQPIVLLGIAIIGIVMLVQHKAAGLVALGIAAICAVGLVFNPSGAKDAMLSVFNMIIGGGTITGIVSYFLIL